MDTIKKIINNIDYLELFFLVALAIDVLFPNIIFSIVILFVYMAVRCKQIMEHKKENKKFSFIQKVLVVLPLLITVTIFLRYFATEIVLYIITIIEILLYATYLVSSCLLLKRKIELCDGKVCLDKEEEKIKSLWKYSIFLVISIFLICIIYLLNVNNQEKISNVISLIIGIFLLGMTFHDTYIQVEGNSGKKWRIICGIILCLTIFVLVKYFYIYIYSETGNVVQMNICDLLLKPDIDNGFLLLSSLACVEIGISRSSKPKR